MALLSTIFLVLLVAAIGVIKKVFSLSMFSPPMILSSIWVFFIFTSLFFFEGYSWNYGGLIWILLACIFYAIGYAVVARSRVKSDNSKTLELNINKGRAQAVLVVFIVLSLIYTFTLLGMYGISMTVFLDINQLAEVNNMVAVERYSGGGVAALALQVLLAFVYASPLLGGFMLVYAESKKQRVFYLMSPLPVALAFSVTNEKATFILSVFFVFSGILIGYLHRYGHFPRLGFKKIIFGVLGMLGLMLVLLTSMTLRIGEATSDNFGVAIEKAANSYMLSHVPAFDHIFPALAEEGDLSWGQYTFYGIADTLNLADREQGIYNDYFYHGEISTNVYSVFRGLILDFGVIGALLLHVLTGAATGLAVRYIIVFRRQTSLAIGVLAIAYSAILFSFAVSPLSYMSLIVAYVLFVVACKLLFVGQADEASKA